MRCLVVVFLISSVIIKFCCGQVKEIKLVLKKDNEGKLYCPSNEVVAPISIYSQFRVIVKSDWDVSSNTLSCESNNGVYIYTYYSNLTKRNDYEDNLYVGKTIHLDYAYSWSCKFDKIDVTCKFKFNLLVVPQVGLWVVVSCLVVLVVCVVLATFAVRRCRQRLEQWQEINQTSAARGDSQSDNQRHSQGDSQDHGQGHSQGDSQGHGQGHSRDSGHDSQTETEHAYETIDEYARVNPYSISAPMTRDMSGRAPLPLPTEAGEGASNERYIHYDTPYDFRIFRFGVPTERCADLFVTRSGALRACAHPLKRPPQ